MARLLVIGLDGATFDLIRPWAQSGLLPHLARLMREGTWGEMASTIPPVTAPAFTSFMTGKNPGKTGVFHFIEPMPGSYEIRYINASSRKCRSMWKILNEAGKSVGVIDVPITYPPEPVQGYIIAGTDTPDEDSAATYPPALHDELARVFGDQYLRFGSMQTMNNIRKGAQVFLDTELRAVEQRTRLALHLMKEHPTDVTMVYFKATDHVQHLFWHYMDPAHPRHDPAGARQFGDAILKTYQKVDDSIGRLLAGVSGDTDVVVMSDHGFGPSSPTVLYLNRYLASIGLLRHRDSVLGTSMLNRVVQLLAKRLHSGLQGALPHAVKVKLARLFPGLRRKLDFHRTALASIDWPNTTAYCTEVMATLAPAIWINLEGRQPQGAVPDAEYDAMVDLVADKLSALKDPMTGKQLVSQVYRRQEIYQGPYVHLAPDLTLASWEGDTFVSRPSNRGRDVIECEAGTPLTGSDWSGTHRMNGIFIGAGGRFRRGARATADLVDLAPTILHLAGVPVPDDLDGRVLVEALDEEFLTRHPVTHQPGEEAWMPTDAAEEGYSEDEARKIEEKLRGLGYIE
jgi:predicted AlkP superfamily phosphohydrolase/phosphomutase